MVPRLTRGLTNPDPKGEGHEGQFYNIRVQGYENYRIVCKILQGLDALKALGQELTSSALVGLNAEDESQLGGSGSGKRAREDVEGHGLSGKRLKANGDCEGDTLPVEGAVMGESQRKVVQWLSELGLQRYSDHFLDNAFGELELVKELNLRDLDDLGITLPGHRKKILLAARALKRTVDGPAAAANVDQQLVTFSQASQQAQQSGAPGPNGGGAGEVVVEHISEYQRTVKRYHSGLQ